MTQEKRNLIFRLYEEKIELRKITRTLGKSLSSIQYQLKKNEKI